MSKIKTHYILVSDDAPERIVKEAIRLKAKRLGAYINLDEIVPVRESELRLMTQRTNQQV